MDNRLFIVRTRHGSYPMVYDVVDYRDHATGLVAQRDCPTPRRLGWEQFLVTSGLYSAGLLRAHFRAGRVDWEAVERDRLKEAS